MEIKQYYLGCLSHASYMVSDPETRTAVVVDPQRDVDQYVQDAKSQGLTIREVVLTHFHADFAAGHLELQKRTGAGLSLGAKAQPQYPFTPRREGDQIQLGKNSLRILETPGHTPEAISLVAYEGDQPKAVLTGDTLFVGDVGRPDLAVSQGHTKEELAGQLYHSLHDKLLQLPDEVTVYPAHGPGSLCGSAGLAGKVSTIGRERAENPMLAATDEASFVAAVTKDLPELPAYFNHDAQYNQQEHADLSEVVAQGLKPLNDPGSAAVLDVRSPDDFAAGHRPGSLNVGIDGRFAQWAATLSDPQQPLVLVAPPGREEETITRLGRVGLENVVGYLSSSEQLTQSGARIQPSELSDRLAGENPPAVLDVRTPQEFRKGHIAGAQHIPLGELARRLEELPGEVVVHCQSGYRSSMAASLLRQHGVVATDLVGGIAAWQAQGLPVQS
ncbi:MAG: MBL fold metallo-hydrolase [Candidatus Eremiobacteraeota bacterium]|nr:MBL fold metallo-hydrolase [Candidatus Eremiobacteraeota bacterium]